MTSAHTQEALKIRENPTSEAGTTVCVHCQARWGGLNTAHCSACHETFTTVSAFDKHRAGSHAESTRHCVDPATVGLVDARRAYPCWGHAPSAEPIARGLVVEEPHR